MRRHSALKGKTPMKTYFELSEETPFSDEVQKQYDLSNEHIKNAVVFKKLCHSNKLIATEGMTSCKTLTLMKPYKPYNQANP